MIAAFTPIQPTPSTVSVERVDVAEQAVLGRLLQLGARGKAQADYERIADLKASDFSKSHGLIWGAMQAIVSRREKINITTVESEMGKALGRPVNEAGSTYLEKLFSGHYGDVTDSAKIIREAVFNRNAESTLREAMKVVKDDHLTPDKKAYQVSQISHQLNRQAAALTGRTGVTLRESVGLFWTRIQAQSQTGETGYGIMTGLNAVDEFTKGFQRQKLYVVAGPSGKGKSALGIKIAKEAMQRGARVGFIPLEMTPDEMTSRLMAIESRIDGSLLQMGRVPKESMAKLAASCKTIQGYQESEQFWFLDFSPDTSTSVSLPNINDIRIKLVQHMELYGADILILDQVSIEAMSGTNPRLDEKSILREIITGLKNLAKFYNIPVVVMAQVNRAGDGEDGQRPTLKHLANSSSMGNTPDVVLFIHRPSTEPMAVEPIELIVAKHRGGKTGVGLANFIPALTDFEDR